MTPRISVTLTLLIAVLLAALAGQANATVMYTSEASFLSALVPDRYINDLTVDLNSSTLLYGPQNGYKYTIASSDEATLYWVGNNLSVYYPTASITISFIGKAVSAVGGLFWPTTGSSGNATGTMSFHLSDGTDQQIANASSATFTGFTTTPGTTLTSLTFSAVQAGSDGLYPTMQHFIVGQAAVPVPGAVWLLGSGLVGLMSLRRRLRRT